MESYLGKPRLVRETSRVGAFGAAFGTLRACFETVVWMPWSRIARDDKGRKGGERRASAREEVERIFHDVVLAPDLKEQVHGVETHSPAERSDVSRKGYSNHDLTLLGREYPVLTCVHFTFFCFEWKIKK